MQGPKHPADSTLYTQREAVIAPPGLCTAANCTKTYEIAATSNRVLTRRSAGELLRERLCLGRFRGGEYCLPRNALFPLLRLRLGLQLLEFFLLGMCRLLSARSWLPHPFLSLLLDLVLQCRSIRLLLRSFPELASSCLAGDLVPAAALSLLAIAEDCRAAVIWWHSMLDRGALSRSRRPLQAAMHTQWPRIYSKYQLSNVAP